MFKSHYLTFLSVLALAAFLWPFWLVRTAVDENLVQWLVVPAIFVIAGITLYLLDGNLAGPKQIALLGFLAALGAAVRVATGGAGGFELVFAIVILGGAAYGSRFGFSLGALTIIVSSLFFGGLGPWTAFQMFATAWVSAGAGIIAKRFRKSIAALAVYAVIASYSFGLLMNAWFWPFATGFDSSISYSSQATGLENFTNFITYSLISSTFTWDTVRAVSVAAFIVVFGRAMLRSLERAKI